MKERTKSAIILALISLGMSVALGALFALFDGINTDYLDRWGSAFMYIYLFFGLPGCVSAVLMAASNVGENLCFGFGTALVWGTYVSSAILDGLIDGPQQNVIFIAFIVTALICHLVWIGYFKPDKE